MHIFSDRAGPQGLGRPPIGNTCWPRMLPHTQLDLHQSLPQKDQALDECFNLVNAWRLKALGESEFPAWFPSRPCNHKGFTFVFFLFVLNNHKDSDMHLLVSWFLCILLYSSNPQITRKTTHLCGILPWITMIASCGRLTLHPVCYKARGSCLVGEKA